MIAIKRVGHPEFLVKWQDVASITYGSASTIQTIRSHRETFPLSVHATIDLVNIRSRLAQQNDPTRRYLARLCARLAGTLERWSKWFGFPDRFA